MTLSAKVSVCVPRLGVRRSAIPTPTVGETSALSTVEISMFEAIAIVEFRNCAPFVYRIKSDKPINIDRVAKHFRETEEWDEVRDNITIVDDLTEITL